MALRPPLRVVCALAGAAVLGAASGVACGSSARPTYAEGGDAPATEPAGGSFAGDASSRDDGGAVDGPCPDVDVLFVVDNSGSMADKQARLAASFPGFASAILTRLPSARSVHVGVVATSAYYDGKPGGCLVTKTSGPQSTNAACLAGAPYLDARQPDFAARFACVAKVGSGGDDDEVPMKSLLGALSAANAQPGGCNAGFLRPEALLVVVVITDEDDVRDADCDPFSAQGTCGSGGTPAEWAKAVIDAKGGHPENVVVLSLLSRTAGTCSNAPTVNLASFTKRFPTHAIGDVCEAAYDGFFASSLPVVDRACASFVPPR